MRKKESQDPKCRVSSKAQDAESLKHGRIARRDFVKLFGGTGVLVSSGIVTELLPAQEKTGKVVGPGAVPITLNINGQAHKLSVEPRTTLLDALRDQLDLTGAKKVCDRGTCGACTVIMNDKPVYSCSVLAIDAAWSNAGIQTIEGLAPEDQLHPVSAAFVDNDAQQCGFCTPGFVMACTAYLKQNPKPTYEQVKHALGGNLCRCGTYVGVRKAVFEAAPRMRG